MPRPPVFEREAPLLTARTKEDGSREVREEGTERGSFVVDSLKFKQPA